MGELERMVPLAEQVFLQIMKDTDAKPEVRAQVASRVLESEGKLKGQKVGGGKTFVLNLKAEDVKGALDGMRTVFGEARSVKGGAAKVRRLKAPRAKAKEEQKGGGGEPKAIEALRRAIEAERGVQSEPSA